MKQTVQTVWRTVQHNVTGWCLLALFPALVQSAYAATTITIGKGSGVIWEGLPFNVTLTAYMPYGTSPSLDTNYGVGYITDTTTQTCMSDSSLTTIAGYRVLQIAPGVGIAPRAWVDSLYWPKGQAGERLYGSIGLPETRGTVSPGGQTIINPVNGRAWCLPPRMSNVTNFFLSEASFQTTMRGTWVMVADGTQTSQNAITVGPFWAHANPNGYFYNLAQNIFSLAGIQLRISTLECTVNTPTQINFGAVARNLQSGAELGVQTHVLAVNCSQDSSRGVDVNINVQFRALTGLYGSAPTRLALSQGGGYITGEIDRGVTGSGNCTGISGLSFDSTPLKLGSITSAQSTQNTSNLVTWRLCSGGSTLPAGNVSAAAEMLVTFN